MNRRVRWVMAGLVWSACVVLRAAEPVEVKEVSRLGFDPSRLERLDALVQKNIDEGRLAGAVLSVWRHGEPVRLRAFGQRDREAGQAMQTDAIFRVASMTKAVTSTAVMMLYEEGRFMLHDPIEKYLPEFKDPVVAIADPTAPKGYRTEKAHRSIQIRDLLSHTAGISYGWGGPAEPAEPAYKEAGFVGWYFANRDETIGDVVSRIAKLPLQAHPGEAWQYGYSTDILGRLVEVVSGMPLDQFFEKRLLGPLKMKDTSFFLPPEKAGRLATVYGLVDGKLVKTDQGAYVEGPRKCFSGGAGLLTTASDYSRFLQMLLNEGELDGVRLLSPKSVRLMHENHTGTKFSDRDARAFGLGFWVLQEGDVAYHGELASAGSYGWGSAYFPQYVVDPKEDLFAFVLCQLAPSGDNLLNQQFKVQMYQALVK